MQLILHSFELQLCTTVIMPALQKKTDTIELISILVVFFTFYCWIKASATAQATCDECDANDRDTMHVDFASVLVAQQMAHINTNTFTHTHTVFFS